MTAYSASKGFQRAIHSIENSPFRTKFEKDIEEMEGNMCIGCISDTDPQPILVRSKLGVYAVCTIGIINNAREIEEELLDSGCASFETMSSGSINSSDLVGALIAQKPTFTEGIKYVQQKINGTVSLMILTKDGIIAARDKEGRLPILVGKREDGYCLSFESFSYQKLGYETCYELGPGEIINLTSKGYDILSERTNDLKICSFLWTYYGYPTAVYEGVNVEVMRTRNGEIMAEQDMANGKLPDVDYICGIPDSGVPHAIGYANRSGIPFARPFIKYTPTWSRSFMPTTQSKRNVIAKMKLIAITDLIKDKSLLLIDDSIVRGTQLRETTEFLYQNGAKEVHIRPACPPLVYGCKYVNFSRSNSDMDLITRRVICKLENTDDPSPEVLDKYTDPDSKEYAAMVEEIRKELNFTSLQFNRLDDMLDSVGIPRENLCTFCWDGKE